MITDQKTIDALKELNYSQVYEKGKEDARQEILDKIDSMNGYVHVDSFIGELKRFIEQLNQPKENKS